VSAGRIILLIFGVLILLAAVGLLFGGGAIMWANSALTDSEGFYTTGTVDLDRDSHAIVTTPVNMDVRAAWLWGWGNLATIKVEGSNDNPSKQIFIGIAEESHLNAYLSDVEYDEITEFDIDPFEVTYVHHPGASEPAAPTSETFWEQSAHGAGVQTLEWELEAGSFSIVLMNDDGSAGIDLSIVFGAKVPLLFQVGVGLLVGGVVALAIGTVMVYFAARRPRTSPPTHITSQV